jgi:exopolysaccharide biosynthesis polyprenyl glycosylphosphotransferase
VLAVLRLLLRAVVRGARQHECAVLVASDSVRIAALRARFESASSAWISIDACLGADEFLALPEAAITWDTVLVEEQTREKTRVIRKATSLGKSVLLVPGIAELWMVGAHLVEVDDQLLFRLSAPHLPPAARSIKRLMDVASAALLLTLTAPILLLAVLLIWLGSRGPVFYAQTRVGANGRPFTLYKLRTMVVDAEERTGPVLASSGDARITSVGRMLRATRIDELPQLGNVLLGEMSLIGPRPERPQFVAQYCALIPGYELRHAVKPGITGLAQVYGGYTTAPEHKLRFDLVYIYDYSLLLDLQIAFKTLLTVLRPDRAEGIGKDPFTPEDLYEQTMAECNNREVTRV